MPGRSPTRGIVATRVHARKFGRSRDSVRPYNLSGPFARGLAVPDPEIVTALPRLPARADDGHKGTYGHVLVIAGSVGMSGAAILCASGALRGGAGLVTVATPEPVQPIVAAAQPCALSIGLPVNTEGHIAAAAEQKLVPIAAEYSVLAVGPGLGAGLGVTEVVTALMTLTDRPIVLDADGLNCLGSKPQILHRSSPTVATPHPGEFARLRGISTSIVQQNRESLALSFAREFGLVLVLKGHQTLVTDGQRLYRNTTGNPGMATGGSGDVLTGLIAALIAQGLDTFAAAQLGVHLHGLAGDFARDEIGDVSLIASDLLTYLPRAFRVAR
jgi:ADP-dependent NAD(P)H-hydrate dehydratase